MVYGVWHYKTGESIGGSAVIERRVPGGWESRFALPGDEWAAQCDLGMVRYRPFVAKPEDIRRIPDLRDNSDCMHVKVAEFLRSVMHKTCPIHLHFPTTGMLKNTHKWFDAGDYAHHPPGFEPVPGMLMAEPESE